MSDLYYRIVRRNGEVATLQDFDEDDYMPGTFLADSNNEPLKFDSEAEAHRYYDDQVFRLAAALRATGPAVGLDSTRRAGELIADFNAILPTTTKEANPHG
ncbi:hypothetical protein [Paenarthrobacter nitroguajacolicus]|uniref:hypothetical protein n=1 Tax=Paenarthrobacter nitroguajacolicus TaxID=211146 RepID=UPI0015BEA464|nr:hypothetical protein [Paenarthrobacter nitroguajacolicus]NWL34462.1 hypothetical protein [Paenarthrobacter nitroguajacolicus]